jgi:hypothetical protein
MARSRTYSDADLRHAVAEARSWRATLRVLGLKATSAAAIRSVRRRADELDLDYTHFAEQRHWNDGTLEAAIRRSDSWDSVTSALGMRRESAKAVVRGHARRMGIDVSHLDGRELQETAAPPRPEPGRSHLRRAGPSLAAGWFLLCGHDVAWPLEPCPYDLLVHKGGTTHRVQVKTTTLRAGSTWAARLTHTARSETPYDIDEIDWFFVIDGDLACYLIPAEAVGGRFLIHLAKYRRYRVAVLPLLAGTAEAGSTDLDSPEVP